MSKESGKLNALRGSMKLENDTIPVLESGKEGAIELDPKKSSHRDWYEGK